MADPFLGEIRLVSFNFAPRGFAVCNGQLLPINQNQALFALLGTMYGGNGQTNFALPDFRGRTPMHVGSGAWQGQQLGADAHTLTINELPAHTHLPQTAPGAAQSGLGTLVSAAPAASPKEIYGAPLQAGAPMPALTNAGGSQAHENRMPSHVITFTIALQGIFPSQN